ncbi:Iron-sulfur cluster assembly accessory protein [Desulfitobacterium dichloroeliminans LMG P-21439]|uniref:Iron-sulfur cluster assembly accessory protein n=1 Tax=Desulfitobacterium dichloroeliminans (strain LMG P-21439 / DCA1) TaxID=871963 RepID=L0F9F5_DESDL|nr:iron-sulfur cluster assembly accessory protein [Desulfitobacterium dichloroeliminans]AGA69650.1 Iron-sulfur cluster assembly accessory protein [Desulfitobacterium dichloroeliminans LMG P-21439]
MINISELAAEKIKEVQKSQNKEGSYLRLYLAGFGCGGPSFGMTLEDAKTDVDVLDEEFGVSVITASTLSEYLEGAFIDFLENEEASGFEIRLAKDFGGEGCGSSCGSCGGSC